MPQLRLRIFCTKEILKEQPHIPAGAKPAHRRAAAFLPPPMGEAASPQGG